MSLVENKALIRRYFEAGNSKNMDVLDELIDPNLVSHDALPVQPPGLEGFKQIMKQLFSAFPDTEFTIDDMIAEGDKVVVRYTYEATHKGEFMGIAPSGKKMTSTTIVIYRIVDGKIKENWVADRRSSPSILEQIRSG